MGKRTAWIFLIAFAIRALLPPGFMVAPADAASVGFQVVVCSSQGTKLVTIDENGQPIEPSDPHAGESITCAYGPPPLAIANANVVDFATERQAERIAHDGARAFALERRAHAVRYARGPPPSISI